MPAKGLGAASPRLILPSFYLRQKKLGNISLADSSSHPATNKRKDTITIQMKAKKLTVKRSGTKHTAAFLYDGDTLVASINRPFDDTQVERWVRLFKAAPDFLQACESVVAKWNPETGRALERVLGTFTVNRIADAIKAATVGAPDEAEQ